MSRFWPVGAQQDVGQDRDRVAAFDHAMDVVQRLQKVGPLNSNTHGMLPLSTVIAQARIARREECLCPKWDRGVDGQNGRILPDDCKRRKQEASLQLPFSRAMLTEIAAALPKLQGLAHKGAKPEKVKRYLEQ